MATLHERMVCPFDCPDTCAIQLTLEDSRAVAIRGQARHEFTHGFLCHKVSRYLEHLYHPDRLLWPLRRVGAKGEGRFERVSWDWALNEIASRLDAVRSGPHGPQAILPYSYCGTMGKIQGESLDRRFFHALGASQLARTICATAGVAGYIATVGSRRGMAPEQFDHARTIINWGSNTAETNSHLWVRMHRARKHGARIITIDPYQTRTARHSDWHLAPRVGTDAALALGMMHVIFRDGLEDTDYLDRYCHGTEQLRDRVQTQYTLDRVSRMTGLSTDDIERLATVYATEPPAAIRVNYGLQRHRGGGMAVRTVACLPAVTGAWRSRAGGVLLSTSGEFELNTPGLQRPGLIPPGTRTVNMVQLAEALHAELPGPPVEALFVYCSNPAAVAPDLPRVLAGLRNPNLFTVVHEQFLTDTCDYADIVLPATMQPEHFDLHAAYGHHWVQLNLPALAAPGECRSNTDVFRQLAARLNLPRELFEVSDEELAREALWEGSDERPAVLEGITVDTLRTEGPQKLRLEDAAPFATGGFPTSSGKCEFYSEALAQQGLDPLPTWTPAAESPESQPELAARYPLQLLTPPSPHFLNSTFVNSRSLAKAAAAPELILNPLDADARQIRSGDRVRVRNDRGVFEARVNVNESVRSGVAVAPGIWWNRLTNGVGNSNLTTATTLTDLGGGATFFDNLVEVERLRPAEPSSHPDRRQH